jgi:hypothetical protein
MVGAQVAQLQKDADVLRRASASGKAQRGPGAALADNNGGADASAHEHEDAAWQLQVLLRAEKENNRFLASSLAELQVTPRRCLCRASFLATRVYFGCAYPSEPDGNALYITCCLWQALAVRCMRCSSAGCFTSMWGDA